MVGQRRGCKSCAKDELLVARRRLGEKFEYESAIGSLLDGSCLLITPRNHGADNSLP